MKRLHLFSCSLILLFFASTIAACAKKVKLKIDGTNFCLNKRRVFVIKKNSPAVLFA